MKNLTTARLIDFVSPIGIPLIVSLPRAGKTTVLQNIAQSITANHPECYLMVLLITKDQKCHDMQRSVKGEVVASTFDEPASRHVKEKQERCCQKMNNIKKM